MEADNYSGMHGVIFNPANITDSRVKYELNLASFDALIGTDFIYLTKDNISELIDDLDTAERETFPSNTNQFYVNADVLGPSLMINLSEKHSIGVLTRARVANNYNNINGELLESLIDGFPSIDYEFDMQNLTSSSHIWGEIGLVYGRTLYDKDYHFVKGGITLKYLLGGLFAHGNSTSLTGDYNSTQGTLNTNGAFSYLINHDSDADFTKDDLTPGYGMDIGFVYEYRPRSSSFSPGNEDERGINKYKFKVGIALLDYGAIKYEKIEQNKYDLNATVNTNTFEGEFEEKLENNYSKGTPVLGNVTAALPSSLRINVDYSFTKNIFTSINYAHSLTSKNGLYANNSLNLVTLTPRFESKIISVYTPINYSNLGGISFGAGLRVGPLFVGSGTLFSSLLSKKAELANVYLGLKVPLYQRSTSKPRKRKR